MRWLIVTSNKSKFICKAQTWLLQKYARVTPEYIDMEDKPIENWCRNVYDGLNGIKDKHIIFGLDDYLPTGELKKLPVNLNENIERLGFGYGDSRTKLIKRMFDTFFEYDNDANYRVTCQFSIWRTEALLRVLNEVNGSPWDFEKKGECKAFALKVPAFKYIEESALSKRWEGVNVRGMSKEDVEQLIELKFLEREKLINYGVNI